MGHLDYLATSVPFNPSPFMAYVYDVIDGHVQLADTQDSTSILHFSTATA